MLTGRGRGRQRREQRAASSRSSARSRTRSARPAPAGHAGLRRRAVRHEHRPASRLLRRQLSRRRSTTRSRPAAIRTPTNFKVQQPEPGRRPDGRAAGRPPQPARRTSTRSAARSTAAARSRRWTASTQEAFEFVTGDTARKAFDISTRRRRSCATATAATAGARARCSPGGWSRPARRSSPSTSAAGTITGTCKAGMERYLPKVDQLVYGLFTDLAERGLLRHDAGGAVRRVQPHAEDERRRQRRRRR